MRPFSVDDLRRALAGMIARIRESEEELNALDAELGDGDLGSTLVSVAGALERTLALLPNDMGGALAQLAVAIGGVSGSSFSCLLISGLSKAEMALRGKLVLDAADRTQALSVALTAMLATSGAELGDKTMLDVIAAMARAPPEANLIHEVRRTLEIYRSKACRAGRARMAGVRSLGRDDPGMLAILRLVEGATDMRQRLAGRRAIVTGGAAGIGRGVAFKLAEEGARIGVLDINFEQANEVAAQIVKAGGCALAVRVNVADEEQVESAIQEVERHFGGLDTVIANAGVQLFGRDAAATELDLQTWRECIDVNLTGVFLTCKHGLRALQRNGSGAVVITGSPTGNLGCAPTFTAYSASKAGCFGLMRILAIDYVQKNIRINAVLPGTVNSPMVTTLLKDPVKQAEYIGKIPMGRVAAPSEIANVIAFLASDEASFVTGAAWYADGGLSGI